MSETLEKSWYVKYRPKTLEEYSGDKIKNIVEKSFKSIEKYPHTIFVTGPAGTGKTTICRMLSKYYLCENPNEDGTPCEQCSMCETINEMLIEGNSIDVEIPGVQEIDSTIENGKDAIQNIIEDAIQPPLYTKFKVIIFDECHMISPAAQNSLLKVLEDIPNHLVCMLCTTNEEKVLTTIKSRMQLTMEARKQTVGDMAKRLLVIAENENLETSKKALEIIAKRGGRVPRDCINILEKIAKANDGVVTVDTVREYLGDLSSDGYIAYFEAANKSLCDVVSLIRELKEKDIQYKKFINGLIEFTMDALYVKYGLGIDDLPVSYVSSIKRLFDTYSSEEFDMLLQIIEHMLQNSYTDSEAKLELLLTTTAMRISKIDYMSKGLASEREQAVIDNKKSLYEHSKLLKKTQNTVSERLKMDLDIESIASEFDEAAVIDTEISLLDNVDIPDIIYEEYDGEQDETIEDSTDIDKNIDELWDE